MTTNLQDFLPGYLAEAEELLAAATSGLLALEQRARQNESDPRTVRDLFRALHTLKGLSAMIGVEAVVDLTHEMESVFRAADRTGGKLSPRAVDVLLTGLRAVEARVRALGSGHTVQPAPANLVEALSTLQAEAPRSPSLQLEGLESEIVTKLTPADIEQLTIGMMKGRRGVRVDFAPSPSYAAEGITITSVRERLGKIAEIVKVVPRSAAIGPNNPTGLFFVLLLVTDATTAELAEAAGVPAQSFGEIKTTAESPWAAADADAVNEPGEEPRRDFVRVDVHKLNETLECLSALIVNRFSLSRAIARLAAKGADTRELDTIMAENGRQLRDLRASIMRSRLVPMSELLARVPLVVRGAAKATGKNVKVDVQVGAAELDKGVAERVFPAVVHLIRNAVDHAIETPPERRALGKPEDGSIEIRCFDHGDQLELTIHDDGRGIDAAKAAARAGTPLPTTSAELLQLITRPGLSTTDFATRTSGRGMGMDIVKRTVVDELGGQLALRTERGHGTTFALRIPLTISIINAFSVACGAEVFVVPVSLVSEIVDVAEMTVGVGPALHSSRARARVLRRRGETVPLFSLASLLDIPLVENPRPKAIIVGNEGRSFAFEVTRMLGQQEVVVRPLGDPLVQTIGVSGSTDLGDGKPVLVLDLMALGGAAEAA